jgi:hypothetical protein
VSGADIIARTLSVPAVTDAYGGVWQYHSRSDRHSKVACWAILFDLLQRSSLLRKHVEDGKVTFGINRQMNDWETGKKKDLDLVVARTPGVDRAAVGQAIDLRTLADRYGLILTDGERSVLEALPEPATGVAGATVLVALEAKACMTAHIKALPRLYDELSSSHATVHGDNSNALAIGFVMINFADTFISPDQHRWPITDERPAVPTHHSQPHATQRTVAKMQELRRRPGPGTGQAGFDALGLMLVTLRNDGSPVDVVTNPPAPAEGSAFHYSQMIGRAAHLYDSSFGHV